MGRVLWQNGAPMTAGAGIPSELLKLTPEQQAWALHSERLWAHAHALAGAYPGLDAGDIYHALRCLELTPSERLARGLGRGNLRADSR